jgi:hypothetical protein
MDRIALTLVLFVSCGGGGPESLAGRSPASDQQTALSADQKTLLDLEQDWARALERGDLKTLDRLLASDFVDSNYMGGFVSKAQMSAPDGARQRPRRLNHLQEMQARAYGDAGVVNGVNLVTDARGKFLRRVRFTDIFIRRHGRW